MLCPKEKANGGFLAAFPLLKNEDHSEFIDQKKL